MMRTTKSEYSEMLEKIPAFNRGKLTPAEAHRITQLLENDEQFSNDAFLEQFIVDTIADLKPVPLPKGLVAKSVREAVGDAGKARWLSLDTFLVALGVGVGCAATGQFLSGKVDLAAILGEWIGNIAGIAVDGSFGSILGIIVGISLTSLIGGGIWVVRMFRS